MSEADQMAVLAQSVEDTANHVNAVTSQVNEEAGHVLALTNELDGLLTQHGGVYDAPTATGDSTRGVIQGAKDAVDEAHGLITNAEDKLAGQATALHAAAQDIREHAERIAAAGTS